MIAQSHIAAEPQRKLIVTPCTIREACLYIDQIHRHHRAPQGALFAVACSTIDKSGSAVIVGVATVGRPVARREATDSWCAEITRVATDGTKNACSLLYGACWRAARALGYQRLITYTLQSEAGVSLRASGWIVVGETRGGSWSCKSRPRVDKHPLQAKIKWSKSDL